MDCKVFPDGPLDTKPLPEFCAYTGRDATAAEGVDHAAKNDPNRI
jgi:hypothetical protein